MKNLKLNRALFEGIYCFYDRRPLHKCKLSSTFKILPGLYRLLNDERRT